MLKRNKTEFNIPNQSFVEDVDIDVLVSHPLKTKKTLRIITYLFLAAFFVAGGVIGIKTPYENSTQQSANIAAYSVFFGVGLLFIVLSVLLFRSKIVIKKVKSVVIGVWAGIRKNTVYLGNKRYYKGKDKDISVTASNKKITVHINRNKIYFE